jgi:2'-hydroxyisoflavone reductase
VTLFNRGKSDPAIFPDVEQLRGDRDPKVGDGLKALAGDRRWDAVLDTSTQVPRVLRASVDLLSPRVGYFLLVWYLSALYYL